MGRKDEIAAARRKKQSNIRRRRTKSALRVTAIALCAALLASVVSATTFKDIGDFFNGLFSKGSYPSELSSSQPRQVEKVSGGYAVTCESEVLVFNNAGARLQTIAPGYTELGSAADGNKILVYSIGGREAALFNRTTKLYDIATNYDIISGTVGASRCAALITESERYTAELVVFSASGKEILHWYCADNYPYAAFFDADASHVAVCSLYISNGVASSCITVLDVSSGNEAEVVSVECVAVRVLLSNTKMLVIGDTESLAINSAGETVASFDYDGDALIGVEVTSGGRVAVALGDNQLPGINRVIITDRNLSSLTTISPGCEINDICIARNKVYILGDARVLIYALDGEQREIIAADYNAVAIVAHGSHMVEILPDTAVEIE